MPRKSFLRPSRPSPERRTARADPRDVVDSVEVDRALQLALGLHPPPSTRRSRPESRTRAVMCRIPFVSVAEVVYLEPVLGGTCGRWSSAARRSTTSPAAPFRCRRNRAHRPRRGRRFSSGRPGAVAREGSIRDQLGPNSRKRPLLPRRVAGYRPRRPRCPVVSTTYTAARSAAEPAAV